MNLWVHLTAERIEWIDATDEIRRLIKRIGPEDLRNPEIWQKMTAIVQLQPNNDILPVRCHFGEKNAFNIGLEHVVSRKPLWYTLNDVIASKLLTGKTPNIVRAIKFWINNS